MSKLAGAASSVGMTRVPVRTMDRRELIGSVWVEWLRFPTTFGPEEDSSIEIILPLRTALGIATMLDQLQSFFEPHRRLASAPGDS